MPHLDSLLSRRSRRSRFANAVLAAAFCGAAVGAYQVYMAKCAQDHTVYEARRTYARYAAFTFAREAGDAWDDVLHAAFRDLPSAREAARGDVRGLPDASVVTEGLRAAPAGAPPVLFVFRADADARPAHPHKAVQAVACDSVPTPALRVWVATQVAADRARRGAGGDPRTFAARRGEQTLLVAYQDAPGAAYGFVADLGEAARTLAGATLDGRMLLPPQDGAASGTSNARALTLWLRDGAGRTLYATPAGAVRATLVQSALPGDLGMLRVTAGLQPDFAMAVASPGWTWNRAQFTYVVITLTAGLIVVALLQLRRERAAAQLRADFVANVSHELRTPLAQIRMFAEMLRIGWIRTEEERRRSIHIIDQEARRLTHLVENILQFSRAERRTPKIAPERLALAPFVADVVECFSLLAGARHVRVQTDVDDALALLADRDALRQVLLNLLDNAVKYGPEGQTVVVGAARAPAHADGTPRVRLWVDDEGPGIPARDRAKVWEPFHRLARPIDGEVAGNGIGLSVVRELVRVHGGEATIEGAPGGGARFVLTMPAAQCTPHSALRTAHSSAVAPSEASAAELATMN